MVAYLTDCKIRVRKVGAVGMAVVLTRRLCRETRLPGQQRWEWVSAAWFRWWASTTSADALDLKFIAIAIAIPIAIAIAIAIAIVIAIAIAIAIALQKRCAQGMERNCQWGKGRL